MEIFDYRNLHYLPGSLDDTEVNDPEELQKLNTLATQLGDAMAARLAVSGKLQERLTHPNANNPAFFYYLERSLNQYSIRSNHPETDGYGTGKVEFSYYGPRDNGPYHYPTHILELANAHGFTPTPYLLKLGINFDYLTMGEAKEIKELALEEIATKSRTMVAFRMLTELQTSVLFPQDGRCGIIAHLPREKSSEDKVIAPTNDLCEIIGGTLSRLIDVTKKGVSIK